jgi:hypothetical protein
MPRVRLTGLLAFTVEISLYARIEDVKAAPKSDMPLSELLPTVDQLSHQDKLRLIHFLLLAVAKEEGCSLELSQESDPKNTLLTQMALTAGVVWSPQTDRVAVEALSDLLLAAKASANA